MRFSALNKKSVRLLVEISKGKKVKNQKLLCSGKAKAQGEVAAARLIFAALRRTAVAGEAVPVAAAMHPEGA